jgi:hypothetical protein
MFPTEFDCQLQALDFAPFPERRLGKGPGKASRRRVIG